MTWIEIGQDHLKAAKGLVRTHPRSAVSRAYYAAHSVLTERLEQSGWKPSPSRQTASHDHQASLVTKHLGVATVSRLIGRLHKRRLDADYNRRITIGFDVAIQAVREASELFVHLRIREVGR